MQLPASRDWQPAGNCKRILTPVQVQSGVVISRDCFAPDSRLLPQSQISDAEDYDCVQVTDVVVPDNGAMPPVSKASRRLIGEIARAVEHEEVFLSW